MRKKNIKAEGGFRTRQEQVAIRELEEVFNQCPDSVEVKLDNFPKYIKRQKLTRLFAFYELFQKILFVSRLRILLAKMLMCHYLECQKKMIGYCMRPTLTKH